MRVQEDSAMEKLAEILMELGITEELVELAVPYLSGEQEEAECGELFSKLPKLSFANLTDNQNEQCRRLYSITRFHNDVELQRRMIHLVYRIGGASAKYVFAPPYHYGSLLAPANLIKLKVPREEMLNITAENYVFNTTNYQWETISNWIAHTSVKPAEIPPLLENCSDEASNGKIFLLNVYFYLKEKNKEYRPEGEELALLDKFEGLILKNMDTMFKGNLTEAQEEVLFGYLNDTEHGILPVPNQIVKFLPKGNINQYLVKLLVGGAFLHWNLSKKLDNFVRVAIAAGEEICLDGIYKAVPKKYFHVHERELETRFLIPEKVFLSWCAENEQDEILKEKAISKETLYVSVIEEMIKKGSLNVANRMIKQLKEANGTLRPELEETILRLQGEAKNGILSQIGLKDTVLNDLIKDYLTGSKEISEILVKGEEIRKSGGYYFYYSDLVDEYVRIVGKDEFYQRLMVFFLISDAPASYGYFGQKILHGGEIREDFLTELFGYYERQGLPLYYWIELFQGLADSAYSEAAVKQLKAFMLKFLVQCVGGRREELLDALKRVAPTGRTAVLEAFFEADKANVTVLLEQFSDTSKQVKEKLVSLLKGNSDYRSQVIEKLSSKKAAERETAMQILCASKEEPECREALLKALETEKSAKLAEYLRQNLGMASEEKSEEAGEATAENYIKELHKGNRKRSLAWLYESPMPAVHNKNKEAVTEEYMQAVLLSYSTLDPAGVNLNAKLLTDPLNPMDLAAFAATVFDRWLEKGAEAKKKWVLYFASVYGGSDMVQRFKSQISEWPKISRGAIAVEAVKALACNGSSAALMIVDGISRKFKFRQIKDAAKTALTLAAKELGITTEELADRIVPDLGFGEELSRTFDYGSRKFRVYITPALELEVFDEKEKKLKTMPAPGTKDDPELAKQAYQEFKDMKKLLKTTISSQMARLEYALATERKWTAQAWKDLFVKNPVMHQFAIGLIWGTYLDGKLKETFRYMEDGTFNTAEEDEYELPGEAMIALVHPLELSGEQIAAWKEQLSDYEITQPIEQLERKIYLIEPEEMNKKELERFGGYMINSMSLTGKLIGEGWNRGSVLDGGGFCNFYREELEQNIGVELEFSGAYVGGYEEDVTIYELRFYRVGTVKRGSYVYDEIKPEHTIALKDVPKRFFSETIYQMTKLLSGSSKKDPDWKSHKN